MVALLCIRRVSAAKVSFERNRTPRVRKQMATGLGNPKGIVASSPRLRGTSYLGWAFGNGNNTNGVVAEVRRAGGNGSAATALRLGMLDHHPG